MTILRERDEEGAAVGREHTLRVAACRIGNQINRLLSKELVELGISYTQ